MNAKTLLLAFSLFSIPCLAQDADLHKYGGHANMYSFEEYPAVKAPKGYKVFHISHYGRHGARYNTKADVYDGVMSVLQAGKDSLGLTAFGENVYERYVAVYPSLKSHEGDLSSLGKMQQRTLADRMMDNYPELFKGNAVIEASSSPSHRVIVSMASFCCELQKRYPKAQIDMSANYADAPVNVPVGYNPYFDMKKMTASRQSQSALNLKARIDSFTVSKVHPEAFLAKIFTNPSRVAEVFKDASAVEMMFYKMAVHMQCLDLGEDFIDIFDPEELKGIYEGINLGEYVYVGSGMYCNNIYPNLSCTLLEDILKDGQNAIDGSAPTVRLRFGHDTVLASLMPLMQLNNFDILEPDFDKVMDVWNAYDIPMASNLQIIFYKNKEGNVLVRMLYNEKDAKAPLPQDLFPFYRWEDFSSHYSATVSRAIAELEAL